MKLLHELPFYDELSVVEISKAFQRYARSYKIEITDSKDPFAQLEASKLSIEDLFKDILNEIKGFKYQITVTVLKHTLCLRLFCVCIKTQNKGRHRVCFCLFQFCN